MVRSDRRVETTAISSASKEGSRVALKSSQVETDLTDDAIRLAAPLRGLVDNKVGAVDETWAALRFVWRLENRGSPTSGAK
jgi:hypothetical protein